MEPVKLYPKDDCNLVFNVAIKDLVGVNIPSQTAMVRPPKYAVTFSRGASENNGLVQSGARLHPSSVVAISSTGDFAIASDKTAKHSGSTRLRGAARATAPAIPGYSGSSRRGVIHFDELFTFSACMQRDPKAAKRIMSSLPFGVKPKPSDIYKFKDLKIGLFLDVSNSSRGDSKPELVCVGELEINLGAGMDVVNGVYPRRTFHLSEADLYNRNPYLKQYKDTVARRMNAVDDDFEEENEWTFGKAELSFDVWGYDPSRPNLDANIIVEPSTVILEDFNDEEEETYDAEDETESEVSESSTEPTNNDAGIDVAAMVDLAVTLQQEEQKERRLRAEEAQREQELEDQRRQDYLLQERRRFADLTAGKEEIDLSDDVVSVSPSEEVLSNSSSSDCGPMEVSLGASVVREDISRSDFGSGVFEIEEVEERVEPPPSIAPYKGAEFPFSDELNPRWDGEGGDVARREYYKEQLRKRNRGTNRRRSSGVSSLASSMREESEGDGPPDEIIVETHPETSSAPQSPVRRVRICLERNEEFEAKRYSMDSQAMEAVSAPEPAKQPGWRDSIECAPVSVAVSDRPRERVDTKDGVWNTPNIQASQSPEPIEPEEEEIVLVGAVTTGDSPEGSVSETDTYPPPNVANPKSEKSTPLLLSGSELYEPIDCYIEAYLSEFIEDKTLMPSLLGRLVDPSPATLPQTHCAPVSVPEALSGCTSLLRPLVEVISLLRSNQDAKSVSDADEMAQLLEMCSHHPHQLIYIVHQLAAYIVKKVLIPVEIDNRSDVQDDPSAARKRNLGMWFLLLTALNSHRGSQLETLQATSSSLMRASFSPSAQRMTIPLIRQLVKEEMAKGILSSGRQRGGSESSSMEGESATDALQAASDILFQPPQEGETQSLLAIQPGCVNDKLSFMLLNSVISLLPVTQIPSTVLERGAPSNSVTTECDLIDGVLLVPGAITKMHLVTAPAIVVKRFKGAFNDGVYASLLEADAHSPSDIPFLEGVHLASLATFSSNVIEVLLEQCVASLCCGVEKSLLSTAFPPSYLRYTAQTKEDRVPRLTTCIPSEYRDEKYPGCVNRAALRGEVGNTIRSTSPTGRRSASVNGPTRAKCNLVGKPRSVFGQDSACIPLSEYHPTSRGVIRALDNLLDCVYIGSTNACEPTTTTHPYLGTSIPPQPAHCHVVNLSYVLFSAVESFLEKTLVERVVLPPTPTESCQATNPVTQPKPADDVSHKRGKLFSLFKRKNRELEVVTPAPKVQAKSTCAATLLSTVETSIRSGPDAVDLMMLLSLVEEWNWENGFVTTSSPNKSSSGSSKTRTFLIRRPCTFKIAYQICKLLLTPKVTHWEDLRPLWKIAELDAELKSPFRNPQSSIFHRRLDRFKSLQLKKESAREKAERAEREKQKKTFSGWGGKKRSDERNEEESADQLPNEMAEEDSRSSSAVADEEIDNDDLAVELWEGEYLMHKEEWEELDQAESMENRFPKSEVLELPQIDSLPSARFSRLSQITIPPFPARQLSKPFPWREFALGASTFEATAEGAVASLLPSSFLFSKADHSTFLKFRPKSWPSLKDLSPNERQDAHLSPLLAFHLLRTYIPHDSLSPRRGRNPTLPCAIVEDVSHKREVDRASKRLLEVITYASLLEIMNRENIDDDVAKTALFVEAEGPSSAQPPAIPKRLATALRNRLLVTYSAL